MCFGDKLATSGSAAQPISATATNPTFKNGDQVRVLRKVSSRTQGWNNAWVTEMNDAIGKVGTVKGVYSRDKDITVQIPGISSLYGYPEFALELVKETPAPVVTKSTQPEQTKHGFTVGQRVSTKYGNSGTVTSFDEDFIYIKQDDGNSTGWYPASLILIAPTTPQKVTPAPITTTVVLSRSRVLETARTLAVKLAQQNPTRVVTADMVQGELQKLGYKSTDLGNAAGVIFKGNHFRNTGKTVKSVRPGNNRRPITVWQYVGDAVKAGFTVGGETPAPLPVTTTLGQFIVERLWGDGTWGRSGNAMQDGQSLSKFVFSTREAAQKEADRQIARGAGSYRVATLPQTTPGKFVVETSHDHGKTWERSWNKTQHGVVLNDLVFSTREEAEAEATRHQTNESGQNTGDRPYRAISL